jgi:hypothetical protein
MVMRLHKGRWIRKVRRSGGEVYIRSLMLVPAAAAKRIESDIIGFYRRLGYALTNSTLGGDGGNTHTPQARRTIGRRTKAALANPDIRRRQSDRMRARYADPDERRKHGDRLAASWTPELRARRSAQSKAMWSDPRWRANQCEQRKRDAQGPDRRAQLLAASHKSSTSQEAKSKNAAHTRRRFADPAARAAHGERIRLGITAMTDEAKQAHRDGVRLAWARRKQQRKEQSNDTTATE